MLNKAKYGIRIDGLARTEIATKFERLIHVKGFQKLMSFIEELNDTAAKAEHQLLATSGFVKSFNKGTDERLNKVYEYFTEHLTEKQFPKLSRKRELDMPVNFNIAMTFRPVKSAMNVDLTVSPILADLLKTSRVKPLPFTENNTISIRIKSCRLWL